MSANEYSEDAGWHYAALLCIERVQAGFSVLLLGDPGCGKSTVAGMARDGLPTHLRWNVAPWNNAEATEPPPSSHICYILLEDNGVTLHDEFPRLDGGRDADVRGFVHPLWLVGR